MVNLYYDVIYWISYIGLVKCENKDHRFSLRTDNFSFVTHNNYQYLQRLVNLVENFPTSLSVKEFVINFQ